MPGDPRSAPALVSLRQEVCLMARPQLGVVCLGRQACGPWLREGQGRLAWRLLVMAWWQHRVGGVVARH